MNFIKKNEERLNNLLRHFELKSISDLIKLIINKFNETTEIEPKRSILRKVLNLPYEKDLKFNFDNFSEFIVELINEKRNFNIIIKSPDLFKLILDLVPKSITNDSSIKQIIKILIMINELLIRELGGNEIFENNFEIANYDEDQCYPSTAEAIDLKESKMAYIFEYISEASKYIIEDFTKQNGLVNLTPIPTSFRTHIKPLGLKK